MPGFFLFYRLGQTYDILFNMMKKYSNFFPSYEIKSHSSSFLASYRSDIQDVFVLPTSAFPLPISKGCIARRTRERNNIANIAHTCNELYHAFKT